MNKQKLVAELIKLQKHQKISKSAVAEIVQSIFDHMEHTIQRKKKFSYPGFGSFVVRKRKKRIGRNPKTGEMIIVPARKTVLFRPFQETKNKINSK